MAKEAVAMVSDAKGKAIESALANIEKKFGKGSIMRLGERPHEEAGSISTNCRSSGTSCAGTCRSSVPVRNGRTSSTSSPPTTRSTRCGIACRSA